jgi:3-deoxy-D-arabino-heptulosonate 7-phosphate (DAHP) synthase class II
MPRGKVWEIGRTAGLFADPRTAEFGQFGGSELLAYWPAN